MLTDLEKVWIQVFKASILSGKARIAHEEAEKAVQHFKKFREDQKKEREGEQERKGLD